MHTVRGYVSSYTLSEDDNPLYHIDLLKQLGFYQISEFTSPRGASPFIIEQTNRIGTPKVAAFDKETGQMLGAFKTNSLINSSEELVLNVCPISQLQEQELLAEFGSSDDDYIAVSPENNTPVALFIRLPKQLHKYGIFSRIKSMASHIGKTNSLVMQLIILEPQICDERMLYAIAIILHNRGGLQLNQPVRQQAE